MDESGGSVVIAPEVLTTLVRLVASSTQGVARLSTPLSGRMNRVLRGAQSSSGIDLHVEDSAVTVDVYVVADRNIALLPLGENLQREVSRAISDVLGMPVRAVNVHIEDVQDPFGKDIS